MAAASVGEAPLRPLVIAGVPVLIATPVHAPPYATVLWCHGFRADALAHAAELEACARAGYLAVGIDAVLHGARGTDELTARLSRSPGGALPVMLDIVEETFRELPALIDGLVAHHGASRERLAMVGISMGAFLAYRSIRGGLPLRSVIALLGSPEPSLSVDARDRGDEHDALDAFRRVALLSITAEHDESVPPAPVRRLHERLERANAAMASPVQPEAQGVRIEDRHHELRGSGHLTSADAWAEAMHEMMRWLRDTVPPR
ncbi:MAG: hypothetical protein V4617_18625 [Gemmatimonadota bacterium]